MFFGLLELASNKALEHDDATRARLEKLSGKVMTLHIKDFDQSLTITPRGDGIELDSQTPDHSDVTLSTTISAIVKLSRDGLENADLKTGELEMNGDPLVGQRFAQVIGDLNIDWEAMLAEQIGPAPAKAAGTIAGQAKEFVEESRSQLHDFVTNLIANDMRILAGKKHVNNFLNDVDDIKADVERLGSRLAALLNRTN